MKHVPGMAQQYGSQEVSMIIVLQYAQHGSGDATLDRRSIDTVTEAVAQKGKNSRSTIDVWQRVSRPSQLSGNVSCFRDKLLAVKHCMTVFAGAHVLQTRFLRCYRLENEYKTTEDPNKVIVRGKKLHMGARGSRPGLLCRVRNLKNDCRATANMYSADASASCKRRTREG